MRRLLFAILFLLSFPVFAVDLGDVSEDSTIHFQWTTNDSNGEAITRSTDGTISVYKDNGTTQSVAGVTDTEDFDSITGLHACTIDLSADAFYATGSNYSVVLTGATVDTRSVNAVLASFSIENRFMRGTDSAATALALSTHDGKLDTAQSDLNTLTGTDGATLATSQGNYAPSKAGDAMALTAAATSAQLVDDIWDETIPGQHISNNTAGKLLLQARESTSVREGTAQAGSNATITLDSGASDLDDFYEHNLVVIIDGVGEGQVRAIQTYTGSSRVAEVVPDWVTNPENGSVFSLLAFGEIHAFEVHEPVVTDSASRLASKADVSSLATSSALSTHDGKLDTVDGNVDTILVDTAALEGRLTATRAGYLDNLSAGAIALASALATAQTILDKLDDTVIDNGGTFEFTTASLANSSAGGTGTTPAAVWAYVARVLTDKAGFSLAADQSAVTVGTVIANTDTAINLATMQTTVDKLDDTLQDNGGTWEFTIPALANAPSGTGSTPLQMWAFSTRTLTSNIPVGGARTCTYTLTSTADGAPITAALVWASTDIGGNTIIVSGYTNAGGTVTFFLAPGTYYFWRQKTGWAFINPDVQVVN